MSGKPDQRRIHELEYELGLRDDAPPAPLEYATANATIAAVWDAIYTDDHIRLQVQTHSGKPVTEATRIYRQHRTNAGTHEILIGLVTNGANKNPYALIRIEPQATNPKDFATYLCTETDEALHSLATLWTDNKQQPPNPQSLVSSPDLVGCRACE